VCYMLLSVIRSSNNDLMVDMLKMQRGWKTESMGESFPQLGFENDLVTEGTHGQAAMGSRPLAARLRIAQ
jgi:hypothetical protein